MMINAPTPTPNMTSSQSSTPSQNDKLPDEIKAAQARVTEAANADGWAGRLAKILLLLYVLITGAVAISTVWNNRTTGTLRAAENALNDLQKEKIRADSARKTEVDTQRVREEAASALKVKTEEVRGEAQERTAKLETASNEKIAALNAEAEKAREGIALAQAAAATANEKAESERLTRIELEKTLAPRIIKITNLTNDELRLFAGTKVVIKVADDSESQRFAAQLNFMFGQAGWELLGIATSREPMMEGVALLTRSEFNEAHKMYLPRPSADAAQILSYQLKDMAIHTRIHVAQQVWPQIVPDDAVFIEVGTRPQRYFMEKLTEDAYKGFDEKARKFFQEANERGEKSQTSLTEYDKEERRRIVGRQKLRNAESPQKKPTPN